jgi:hypothetical protein
LNNIWSWQKRELLTIITLPLSDDNANLSNMRNLSFEMVVFANCV